MRLKRYRLNNFFHTSYTFEEQLAIVVKVLKNTLLVTHSLKGRCLVFFTAGCNKQVLHLNPEKSLVQIRAVVFEKNVINFL